MSSLCGDQLPGWVGRAFLLGAVATAPVAASLINSSAIGSGTGLLGQYWTETSSSTFTNAHFDLPPTLARIDTNIDFDWGAVCRIRESATPHLCPLDG